MNFLEIYNKVKAFERSEDKKRLAMPSNCYFLNKDEVLCYPKKIGDGRHPYQTDGLTLWAYSGGSISIEESQFNLFLPSYEGYEANIAFFFGEKVDDGYFPISITGIGKQPFERGIKRFSVYTLGGAYYFAENDSVISALNAFVDTKKRICLTVYIKNKSDKTVETYTAAYLEPHMLHNGSKGFENKWYRSCRKTDYGYLVKMQEMFSRDDRAEHNLAVRVFGNGGASTTTSRTAFTGSTSYALNCSESLQRGKFEDERAYTEFTNTSIVGEIKEITLAPGAEDTVYYVMACSDDLADAEGRVKEINDVKGELEAEVIASALSRSATENLRVEFEGLTGELSGRDEVVNCFMSSVVRQTDFCSRSKNYAGAFIGIRDIMQQIEAAVYWDAPLVRRRIVETLNYIGDDGRAPRQYSYQPREGVAPLMDLRAFIDQGVWIISTVYTYLSFTGDLSILDEVCGYYNFDRTSPMAMSARPDFSDRRDSVLTHLITILEFLISNLDDETGCLHALYGDWNDALDGLGKTNKAGQSFGTGVSVMASLQLYKNINEMVEIIEKTGKFTDRISTYVKERERIEAGLLKYAIVSNGNERKILHGWGDDRSWLVGSYNDHDGKSRDSLTAPSFWILSGMYKKHGEYVADIIKAYERLDAKYGINTFMPAFDIKDDKVGRIKLLPEGTAENGATYNHSTCFGIWSLFNVDEGERAWKYLYKMLPFNHELISTTPYVMPNSFLYNKERLMDGESMSDWFTGAGCVLLKLIVDGLFGIKPTLDSITVSPVSYMPFKNASITLKYLGKNLTVKYEKRNTGARSYLVNGKPSVAVDGVLDLNSERGKEDIEITVID